MPKKRKYIKLSKERALLSDVLPYEIPITFSNRYLFEFICENRISISADKTKITWKEDDAALDKIIQLLFDFKNHSISNCEIAFDKKWELKTIPFCFNISHKDKDFRELTLIHPKNQLDLVSFYDKNKELITYYSDVSPFSIRKPVKVAKFTYNKDSLSRKEIEDADTHEKIEISGKEYSNLKTFFSYKKYSNIHRFYESYQYHRCEKKYNRLMKFDISKCFDSIYTHTITWALLNKEIVKDKISESDNTFGGEFDRFMQNTNYGETNGIIIGPEFSRIFAELILQQIDFDIYKTLKAEQIYHKKDYELFRYVDDFFLFYNDESTRDRVHELYSLRLRDYKMSINGSKSKVYEKPIITELTIAKQKISDLFNKHFKSKIEEEILENGDVKEKYSLYISSNKIITRFKTIVKETDIKYKDILNYALASLDKRVDRLIMNYISLVDKDSKKERFFVQALLEILDFAFFIYSVSPRVNSTIKLSLLLSRIVKFLKQDKTIFIDNKHTLYKKIFDEVFFTLQKNNTSEHFQVETLYLLVIISELGKDYRLEEEILRTYFNIKKDEVTGDFKVNNELNYFSITVALFYMKSASRYNNLRELITKHILWKIKNSKRQNLEKNTELLLLLFDVISCPYLTIDYKKEVLSLFGIDSLQEEIINKRKYWFTKWDDFKLKEELEAKRSMEVYS